jgi:hypothetical protein
MKQLEIELADETEIVRRIYNFTSGHPNVVQRLCRRLIERLNEKSTHRIMLGDLDMVIYDPKFQDLLGKSLAVGADYVAADGAGSQALSLRGHLEPVDCARLAAGAGSRQGRA